MFHSQSQSAEFRVWKWGMMLSLPFLSVFSKVILCRPISTCVPDLSAAAGLPVCTSNLLSTTWCNIPSLQSAPSRYPNPSSYSCTWPLTLFYPSVAVWCLQCISVISTWPSTCLDTAACLQQASKPIQRSHSNTCQIYHMSRWLASTLYTDSATYIHMQMQAFLCSLSYKMMRCMCNTIYNKDI